MATSSASNSGIACLGPKGTWSELALIAYDQNAHEISYGTSITDVFKLLLEKEVDSAFLPIENILEGPVTETLDLLLQHRESIGIVDSSLMRIQHALGSPSPISKIEKIISHPQALGQCSETLSSLCPKASLVPVESTVSALRLLGPKVGVIAPAITLEQQKVPIRCRELGDSAWNCTRFILVKRREDVSELLDANQHVTSICIHPHKDRQGLLHEVLEVISVTSGINILSIHSRPDSRGGFVFHLDLEGSLLKPELASCLDNLREYCEQKTGQTVELSILGSYPFEAFFRLPFSSACIVGGKGKMGQWFQDFLQQKGIEVVIHDKDSKEPLKRVVEAVDVVILSLPMSTLPKLIDEIAEALQPGQLVIENCSIKACSLPLLQKHLHPEVELLGLHTMFGSDIEELEGQNIIVTGSKGAKAQAFQDLLYKHGARLHQVDLETHDRVSSFVQSLLQLLLVCLGETAKELELSQNHLQAQSTPNSRAVWNALERCLALKEELLVDIQNLNPQARATRRTFLEILFRQVAQLDSGDSTLFRDTLRRLKVDSSN